MLYAEHIVSATYYVYEFEPDCFMGCYDWWDAERSSLLGVDGQQYSTNTSWYTPGPPAVAAPQNRTMRGAIRRDATVGGCGDQRDTIIQEYINRGRSVVNSGYRSPVHNDNEGGAPGSFHQWGAAIDLANATHIQQEYTDMSGAAKYDTVNAGADWVEDVTGPCGYGCVHADWRYYPNYAQQ